MLWKHYVKYTLHNCISHSIQFSVYQINTSVHDIKTHIRIKN